MYYSDLVNIQYRIDGFLTQKDNSIKKLMIFIVAKGKEDEAFRKSIVERNQHLEGIEVKYFTANEKNKGRIFKQITIEPTDDSTGYIFFSIADVPCGEFLDFARKIKRCKLLILRECILNDEDFELKISLAYTIYQETLYWMQFDKTLELLRKDYLRYTKHE